MTTLAGPAVRIMVSKPLIHLTTQTVVLSFVFECQHLGEVLMDFELFPFPRKVTVSPTSLFLFP